LLEREKGFMSTPAPESNLRTTHCVVPLYGATLNTENSVAIGRLKGVDGKP
jgi:hypothetical protein